MSNDAHQHAVLIDKIVATADFVRAPLMREILKYLFNKRDCSVSGKELSDKVLGTSKRQDHDPGRVGERCLALRKALQKYAKDAANHDKWRCELPHAVRGDGYQLRFIKIEHSATELFWRPHLDLPEHVMVVCNSYLFFYDPDLDSMFRFSDVNTEGDSKQALTMLKRLRPKAYKKGLKSSYLYLSAGEVTAHEMLQRWFYKQAKVLIPRCTSRDVLDKQIHNSSPILLGRPGANRFIRRILDSPEAAHLGYRFRKPFGAVRIDKPREHEKQILSRFPFSHDGVLGPIPNWEVIFGIVSRLPNPSRHGAVTMVSADYYPGVITQIVSILTDDQRLSQAIAKMGWPSNGPLPESFEMLFAVRLSPGNMEGEGHAELLCGRP